MTLPCSESSKSVVSQGNSTGVRAARADDENCCAQVEAASEAFEAHGCAQEAACKVADARATRAATGSSQGAGANGWVSKERKGYVPG